MDRTIRCRTGAALAVAALLGASAPAAATELLVYRGAGCEGLSRLPAFEAWLGRRVDGFMDFVDYTGSWTKAQGAIEAGAVCWAKRPGLKASVAIPLVVSDGGTLAVTASGAHDVEFTNFARALIRHGFADAYVRPGWEFNGGWYLWSAARDPASFVLAYRRAVLAMRRVPGARFTFVWNAAGDQRGVTPAQSWPGDDVVDVIGLDIYNTRPRNPLVAAAKGVLDAPGRPWMLDWAAAYARAHHKRVALPEWGTGWNKASGELDDPVFVRHVAAWLHANHAAYSGVWDFNAGDENSMMSDGERPMAGAAFKAAFGPR